MDVGKSVRTGMLLIGSVLTAVIIIYVQARFDTADRHAGLGIIQQYRSPTGRTVPEVLGERHPGKAGSWSTDTASSCRQHIEVHVDVDDPPGKGTRYEFLVDINGPSIHPGNEAGKQVIAALDQPAPRPAALPSAAPSTSAGVPAPSAVAPPAPSTSASAGGARTPGSAP